MVSPTLLSTLSKCLSPSPTQTLERTKQLHALILRLHLFLDPFYPTRLIPCYSAVSNLLAARYMFDICPRPSTFLWNAVIRAHASVPPHLPAAISIFRSMLRSDTRPDAFTFSTLFLACRRPSSVHPLHTLLFSFGLSGHPIPSSALLSAYFFLRLAAYGYKVFLSVLVPDLPLWNCLISGYRSLDSFDRCLYFFREMRTRSFSPDGFTVVAVLSSLSGSCRLAIGKGVHSYCLKTGDVSSSHVATAVVAMYTRCGCLSSAEAVFHEIVHVDVVAFSALVTGLSQCGEHERALELFRRLGWRRKLDPVALVAALSASAKLADARPGFQAHAYVLRHGLGSGEMVVSSLVDMYFKCGYPFYALRVFKASIKSVPSYNAAISGLGLHGRVDNAVRLFEEMVASGLSPERSTFSAVLCACCHAGLIEKGRVFFKRMEEEFGLEGGFDHHVYMVRLIGGKGDTQAAYNFVQSLPEHVNPVVWGALLACCETHGNIRVARVAAARLLEGQTEGDAASYKVMWSNICANDKRWEDVEDVRDGIVNGKIIGISRIT